MVFLELTEIVVDGRDPPIAFFVDVFGFDLVEDSLATNNDGRGDKPCFPRFEAA